MTNKVSHGICVWGPDWKNPRTCKHLKQEGVLETTTYGVYGTCDAFPDGIPADIYYGESSHVEHVPGDHGIKYEPAEG